MLELTEDELEYLIAWLEGIKRQHESPTWNLRLTFEEIKAWGELMPKLEQALEQARAKKWR